MDSYSQRLAATRDGNDGAAVCVGWKCSWNVSDNTEICPNLCADSIDSKSPDQIYKLLTHVRERGPRVARGMRLLLTWAHVYLYDADGTATTESILQFVRWLTWRVIWCYFGCCWPSFYISAVVSQRFFTHSILIICICIEKHMTEDDSVSDCT